MKNLEELSKKCGLKFKKPQNIEQAFIHMSYLNENKSYHQSNERLEFL